VEWYCQQQEKTGIMLSQVFSDFPIVLRDEIENLGFQRFYRSNEMLIRKEERLRTMMILLEGCVKIFQENEQGKEFVIGYLKAGDNIAGAISDDSPDEQKKSLVSCLAIEPTRVLLLSFSTKDMLARKHDHWYKYILKSAVTQYKFYNDIVDSVVFQTLDQRIDYFLRKLSQTKQTTILNISHQEIATSLNSSREVVSRHLKRMELHGRLKLGHSIIRLVPGCD
jgi:CRP/FNR family transcriptional regulator, anaerobic regulatory protein